jgi:hypothetical protein
MESVSETGLLSLLRGQSFDWLEIEVVIKMQICQILPVNKKIQHIEALTADLKTSFNPVDCGLLEEFRLLEGLH